MLVMVNALYCGLVAENEHSSCMLAKPLKKIAQLNDLRRRMNDDKNPIH